MQYFQDFLADNLDDIYKRIDFIRQNAAMTQKQFAETLTVSQSAVSKYLTGRMPPADVMLKIAKLGHTSVEWVLTGKEFQFSNENMIVAEDGANYDAKDNFLIKYKQLPSTLQVAIRNIVDYYHTQGK